MEGLGDQLREARVAAGLTLPELQARTKIRYRYLEAMERGAFFEIPGEVYARAFLRTYAREVGLDPDAVVQEFQRWCQQQPPSLRNRPGWRPLGGEALARQPSRGKAPVLRDRSRPRAPGSARLVAVSLALLALGIAVAAASLWSSGSPFLFRWEGGLRILPAGEAGLLQWLRQDDVAAEERADQEAAGRPAADELAADEPAAAGDPAVQEAVAEGTAQGSFGEAAAGETRATGTSAEPADEGMGSPGEGAPVGDAHGPSPFGAGPQEWPASVGISPGSLGRSPWPGEE